MLLHVCALAVVTLTMRYNGSGILPGAAAARTVARATRAAALAHDAAAPPGARSCRPGQLGNIVGQLRGMRKDLLGFWLQHGLDQQHGGFHAVGGGRRSGRRTVCVCVWGGARCRPGYSGPTRDEASSSQTCRQGRTALASLKPPRSPPFRQTLNRGGVVGEPSDKGVVQHARHVWTFSHAAASRLLRGDAAARASAENAARSAWAFMLKHMQRPEQQGTW